MFNNTKYTFLYFSIIRKARERKNGDEKHHIIPRCIGGGDDEWNLVLLTYREHYICHCLLTKMHDSDLLKYAFWAMSNQRREIYFNSRLYHYSRKIFLELKRRTIHWTQTDTGRNIISESWDDKRKEIFYNKVSGKNHWTKKEKNFNKVKDHASMMRENIDRESVNLKTSIRMKNDNPMKRSEISEKFKTPKLKVKCPHCGKEGGKPVMIRYHFNNCKHCEMK